MEQYNVKKEDVSKNEKIQVIVECLSDCPVEEYFISTLGKIIYRLPIINSYVLEINKHDFHKFQGIDGIKALHQNTHITAQMNVARKTVKADIVQNKGYLGRGVTIAILDTGIAPVEDFTSPRNRIVAFKDMINHKNEPYDDNGHGTHVAGIAAGNGKRSGGKYCGIAPESNIVAVKILTWEGKGSSAEVLAGIQWLVDNSSLYGIKVANLSLGTSNTSSTDLMVKAVEAAWNKGITMVVAAGNNGPDSGTITSPGISRKVITVGAADDNKSVKIWGDTLVNFSGRGPTTECIIKPDVIAPGTQITSCLTPTPYLNPSAKDNISVVSDYYMKLSGTSMATPIVTGAIAILLQKYPHLYPDDIKYMLKHSTNNLNYPQNQQGWGLLDIDKLISREGRHVRV